jgi:serine/threonine-protein kinase
MRSQIMFDVPAGLSVDEVKQVYRCLAEDPALRPQAKRLRFFNPGALTTSQVAIPREQIPPGPPLGRSAAEAFVPGAQGLLCTFATNATELAGKLYPLDKMSMTIGRRSNQDIAIPEATVSGAHGIARWHAGSWLIEDAGSTNGTYADHSYERKKSVTLLHGAEVQLGECRLKLVSFAPSSPQHQRGRAYLERRDGLTGLLQRDHLIRELKDEVGFAEWNSVTLAVARYHIRGPGRQPNDRPTILEMLALRRVAQRVVELTEMLLLSIVPVTAGRIGPLKFAVMMTGPSADEARQVVEQVVSQVQGLMPESLELAATILKAEPGQPPQALLDA